jgi:hypothetical protein
MSLLVVKRLWQVRSNVQISRDDAAGQIAEMLRDFKVSKTPTTGFMPTFGAHTYLDPAELW